jgi:hypothetical protein
MPNQPARHASDTSNFPSSLLAAGRLRVVESLVPVAIAEVARQMDDVIGRLADALFRWSDQRILPDDAVLSFNAWNHLTKNTAQLQRGVLGSLGHALLSEIAVLATTPSSDLAPAPWDLVLTGAEDIEGRVLVGNVARDIALDNAAAFVALNIRLGRLLQREEISITLNPFRPAVFLHAVHAAWCRFDRSGQSHLLVLRLLRAGVFVDFAPLLSALNGALIARGIVPELRDIDRDQRCARPFPRPSAHVMTEVALRCNDMAADELVTAVEVTAPFSGARDTLPGYLDALQPHIVEALRQEQLQQAHKLAEADVARRIDSGEVADFVEVFLETQWTRILTMGHSVAAQKPEMLAQALLTMDALIGSVTPKGGPQERSRLVSQLPALLTQINAWLDVIEWEASARHEFFSHLAECHAAIVCMSGKYSLRQQIELAVHVAQKASARRLNKRVGAMHAASVDQFVHAVDSIDPGSWIEFVGVRCPSGTLRLAWVSPLRLRFIFSHRDSKEVVVMTAHELAVALRDHGAQLLSPESVIARALSVARGQGAACSFSNGNS